MNRTKIEWVKNPDGTQGYTWNPITGCLNGCEYCYARKLACGRLRARYLDNQNVAPRFNDPLGYQNDTRLNDPFYPRFWPRRMLEPRDNTRGKGIFVCDMSDLFGIGIPEEWTQRILREIGICHDNRFYLLTKQPQNLVKFSPFPDNCWVGVTVTGVEYMADAVANLACTQAKVRFMSFEPLLGSVMPEGLINFLDWLIIGAQTKPTVHPEISWVEEIVEAADKAGIPVFLKDNLKPLLGGQNKPFFKDHYHSSSMDKELGTSLAISTDLRQEMPCH